MALITDIAKLAALLFFAGLGWLLSPFEQVQDDIARIANRWSE